MSSRPYRSHLQRLEMPPACFLCQAKLIIHSLVRRWFRSTGDFVLTTSGGRVALDLNVVLPFVLPSC